MIPVIHSHTKASQRLHTRTKHNGLMRAIILGRILPANKSWIHICISCPRALRCSALRPLASTIHTSAVCHHYPVGNDGSEKESGKANNPGEEWYIFMLHTEYVVFELLRTNSAGHNFHQSAHVQKLLRMHSCGTVG